VPGSETNPAFVYQMPAVKFISPLRPYNKYEGKIDVNQIPPGPASNPAPEGNAEDQQLANLTGKLVNMFKSILKVQEEKYYSDSGSIRVTAGFGFELTGPDAGPADHDILTVLPVLLCPMISFDPKRDLNLDSGFCRSLAEKLTVWYNANNPSPAQAMWLFNVVVYSTLKTAAGMERPPLVELTNLQLKLSDYQN
jgi:hypothetical protein